MQRLIKTFICAAMLVTGWEQAWGFSLIGPDPATAAGNLSQPLPANFGDIWQINTIGYNQGNLGADFFPGGALWLGDLGGPKNVGEGYRRNVKTVYYAFHPSFPKFFGTQGELAVGQAFAIMNNFFTNHPNGVDGYSSNLTEFPFNSEHFNATAQSLFLTDIKSITLHLLVEQMGLAEPERYTWTLEDRFLPTAPGNVCPTAEQYVVVQRNYGINDQPLTGPQTGTLYSPYVNNLLYTYGIAEDCGRLPTAGITWSATTQPFSVQPGVPQYTAVAANNYETFEQLGPAGGGLENGGFYTGLTEDDAAGLRYLMSSNNIEFETPATGTQLEDTNFSTKFQLTTSDLSALLQFASTNNQAAVQAAFPNVQIDSVANFFVLVSNPVVVAFFTNFPGTPVGTPPTLVVKTNRFILSLQEHFIYSFGNVVILNEHTNTVALLQTTSLAEPIGAPVGSPPITNVTTKKIILTNVVSGDYFTIPPGSCGFDIIATPIKNQFAGFTTNIIATATNTLGGSNAVGFVGTQAIVTAFTNNTFVYFPCNFETSSPAQYQGIQKVQFVGVADGNVDELTGNFRIPITNSYSMVWYNPTNSTIGGVQVFQRIVTRPDFLLAAQPQGAGPGGLPVLGTVTRDILFETGQIIPGLSGPGVIDGSTTFSYNDIGTVWWNGPFSDTNSFLPGNESEVNEATQVPGLLWGSYDGSTNAPIVYPNNLSIRDLESQMIIAISPTTLPDGTNGLPYIPTTVSATGGKPPYTFSISGLPDGLAFLGGNTILGTPEASITNGTPSQAFDVTVQLMDSSFPTNIVTMPMTITIHESP
jgi:hypothetical protein